MNRKRYEKAMDSALDGLYSLKTCGLEDKDYKKIQKVIRELVDIDSKYAHPKCYCLEAVAPDWPCAYCMGERE